MPGGADQCYIYRESDIEFAFNRACFHDSEESVPIGYKTVDFIIEKSGDVYFIEVKRLRFHGCDREMSTEDVRQFGLSGKLIYKFRDTLLWRYVKSDNWHEFLGKKIHYIALVLNMRKSDYQTWRRILRRNLPVKAGAVMQSCAYCDNFELLDVKMWNVRFGQSLGKAKILKV